MANKNVQIRAKSGSIWDNIFPRTLASLVNTDSDGTLQSVVDDKIIDSSNHTTDDGYIRFKDGTQIAYASDTYTIKLDLTYGALFYRSIGNIWYPVPFISKPFTTLVNQSSTGVMFEMSGNGGTNERTGNITLYKAVADTSDQTYKIGAVAIGRWK